MPPGDEIRLLAHGRRFAAVIVLTVALAAPAAASADTTVVAVSDSKLRITGLPGVASKVELRYKLAAEAGFGGVSDRFVLSDQGGMQAVNPDCVLIDPATASCDARGIVGIDAALGDGDDVLVLNAGKGDGVPRRYPTDLRGESGADVIRGGIGNDRISGDAGRDVVAGWSGNDFLFGGAGADGLIGFAGNDSLLGGEGRDALFGQKGHDRMFGGPQNDVLLARDGFRDPKLVCGPGKKQRAITDRRDPRSSNCVGA